MTERAHNKGFSFSITKPLPPTQPEKILQEMAFYDFYTTKHCQATQEIYEQLILLYALSVKLPQDKFQFLYNTKLSIHDIGKYGLQNNISQSIDILNTLSPKKIVLYHGDFVDDRSKNTIIAITQHAIIGNYLLFQLVATGQLSAKEFKIYGPAVRYHHENDTWLTHKPYPRINGYRNKDSWAKLQLMFINFADVLAAMGIARYYRPYPLPAIVIEDHFLKDLNPQKLQEIFGKDIDPQKVIADLTKICLQALAVVQNKDLAREPFQAQNYGILETAVDKTWLNNDFLKRYDCEVNRLIKNPKNHTNGR